MIALGGAAGAVCRYAVAGPIVGKLITNSEHPRVPWGVLAVNLLGCLLIGILAALVITRPADERLRFLLVTGFLGSFTTFSAFGLDTFELLKANAIGLAIANVAASVVGGTALAAAGWFITQRIITP
ncbi:MAG: fluoride efflux transporter CrcB [Planctomycetota bacterium]